MYVKKFTSFCHVLIFYILCTEKKIGSFFLRYHVYVSPCFAPGTATVTIATYSFGLTGLCVNTPDWMEVHRANPVVLWEKVLLYWSAWLAFPPLCSDQSSAGTVRETVYRRRPGLPSRRTHHLEQPAGQCDLCLVSVNLPSAFKNISVPGLVPWHYDWSLEIIPHLQWILKWFCYLDHSKNIWLIDWLIDCCSRIFTFHSSLKPINLMSGWSRFLSIETQNGHPFCQGSV